MMNTFLNIDQGNEEIIMTKNNMLTFDVDSLIMVDQKKNTGFAKNTMNQQFVLLRKETSTTLENKNDNEKSKTDYENSNLHEKVSIHDMEFLNNNTPRNHYFPQCSKPLTKTCKFNIKIFI